MNIKTIIVDDEQDAVNFIQSIIQEYCPKLEIVGTANSAKEASKLIIDKTPELVFLDVEMPKASGFDLLANFPDHTFDVIFVTAFNHYAIKAIKFSAVDYILKPININEFIKAVDKVVDYGAAQNKRHDKFTALLENLRTSLPGKLAIPTSEGMEYLNTQEIIRVEADRSYSWFFLVNNRKILVSRNLKEYQELLSDRNFFRTHNSHLINLEFVKKYIRQEGGAVELSDGSQVPISRGKRDLFLLQMAKLSK
ncbi:MAG: LytTR family DNA-binding domain-containing protein [Bacteroidales bacterium]|nr:LytTR family DNA-binding domain-containing protein [Bacteroidales bacterium]MCF8404792.1 LytTR family DNA-binding domain-containing protein [Bacteroidales bacterium]